MRREHGDVAGSRGGLFDAHCASLHPYFAVSGLARAAHNVGAQIFENSPVTAILPAGRSRRAAAVTTTGTVRADFVIRATEGFTTSFPQARRDVVPLYSLMVASEPQSDEFWARHGLHRGETFADGRHLIIYGQRTIDNRLAFGGRGAPYHFGSSVEPRFETSVAMAELLGASLRQLFPDLHGDITHQWGGPLAMPRSHLPFVICDHQSGLAALGGYTGDGVVLSYLAGRSLAALIAGDRDESDDVRRLVFVQRPARRWEPEPLRWLGINAGLWLANRADVAEQRRGSPSPYDRWLARLLG
jgi:glycine/D-amino acid oxidase-like deaminating enzyme